MGFHLFVLAFLSANLVLLHPSSISKRTSSHAKAAFTPLKASKLGQK